MQLHLIPSEGLIWASWKNGGGRTQEVAAWPPRTTLGDPAIQWRLARAECSRPGPFSPFPGYDRLLMPLEGTMVLMHGAVAPARRLRRAECTSFAGEWPTEVALPNGPALDLNLLLARDHWRGSLSWLPLGGRRLMEEVESGHLVLHLVAGALRVRASGEEEPHHLRSGDSLWLHEGRAGDVVELAGEQDDTALVLARITPVRGAGS